MGDTVRRILRKVGTTGLWSRYNLKGRKDKLPFEASPVYKLLRSTYIFRVATAQGKVRDFCNW